MLPLFAAVALAASLPSAAEAGCQPQASLAGDRELIEAVRRELDAGGLVRTASTPDGSCFALRVRVERRGPALLFVAAESIEGALERETTSPAIAATVIEAWALRAGEGREAQWLVEHGPRRLFSVQPAMAIARSTHDQMFYIPSLTLMMRSDPFVFSIEGHYARGIRSFERQLPGMEDAAILFAAAYETHLFSNVMIAPELAVGAGIGHLIGSVIEPSFVLGGLRERFAMRGGVVLSDAARIEGSLFAYLQPNPESVFGNSNVFTITGIEHGVLAFGLSIGLRYSP